MFESVTNTIVHVHDNNETTLLERQTPLSKVVSSPSLLLVGVGKTKTIDFVKGEKSPVLVEILNDSESKELEERIFPISFFEGFETTPGKFFGLEVLESKNSLMFQISHGSNDLEGIQCFNFGLISKRSVRLVFPRTFTSQSRC